MISRMILNKKEAAWFYLFILLSSPARADEAVGSPAVTKFKEVLVVAEKGGDTTPLADVQGAKIYAGKKTSAVDLNAAPKIVNNNYREAFTKTPGLLVSEETTPLVSIGYRGLNPDRAQFMQVMKDGVPIQADFFGYPEAYYTPPLQSVESIEFVRGGSSLLYGPQPGGTLNYVTKDPYPGAFRLETENVGGSGGFFSNFTSVSGTQGAFGHYEYLHHRRAQGFRDNNSQYEVNYGGSKITVEQDPTAHWTVTFDLYNETHGEPGGLTRTAFDQDPGQTTRLIDRFELNRYAGTLAYSKEISEKTLAEWKLFGHYYERLSWRQRGGGFGTVPSGANASTVDIQDQTFYTGGTDLRFRHEYDGLGSAGHALTAGVFYYHSDSPRTEERGLTSDAEDGALRKDSDRTTDYVSFFLENLFRFGPLSVTPGVRLENVWQSIEEHVNLDKTTTPLADESDHDFVPLFGVGAAWNVWSAAEFYANASQSYRPKIYADAVPLGTNQVVSGDLDEGESWQAETGVRGKPLPYLSWDASVFHMEFEDQTGTVGNTIQNVGDAEYDGAEFAVDFGVCEWLDVLRGTDHAKRHGALSLYGNVTYLDSEFVKGPNLGKTPQFAPDYLFRAGVEYRFQDRVKVRLGGTFAADHFGDDSNSEQRGVPSYKVWDLTAEAKVYRDRVSVFGGINNLFDEEYFARVTSTGIDPAPGRNFYAGVKFSW